MAQHDRYEMDILKQLTRIANSLEKLEKKADKEFMAEALKKKILADMAGMSSDEPLDSIYKKIFFGGTENECSNN